LDKLIQRTAIFLYSEYLAIGAVFLLSILGSNTSVAYASGIILVLKLLGLTSILNALGAHGLNWGIILLTMAILIPIATGEITIQIMLDSFKSPLGIVAIIAGIAAAAAGGYGIQLLRSTPEVVSALIIGTMAGVFFFKGIAVGPLIAGGLVYMILQILKVFN
jgi:uncharacterized membrane protein (DUF441 family)